MQVASTAPVSSPVPIGLPESLAGRVLLTVAASGFVAICAHISLPLPFTPVPLTLQTFAVILVGLVLGPVAGFSALALYLAEGVAGLPVFSPHGLGGIAQLMGPTGGFLMSYPIVAALAGALARGLGPVAGVRSIFARGLVAGVAGTLLFLSTGSLWLAHLLHTGFAATSSLAILPFLPGEAIKIFAAAAIFAALERSRPA